MFSEAVQHASMNFNICFHEDRKQSNIMFISNEGFQQYFFTVYFENLLYDNTLKCLSIGTPKAINFPLVSNEKFMFLGVPVFKHIVMRL